MVLSSSTLCNLHIPSKSPFIKIFSHDNTSNSKQIYNNFFSIYLTFKNTNLYKREHHTCIVTYVITFIVSHRCRQEPRFSARRIHKVSKKRCCIPFLEKRIHIRTPILTVCIHEPVKKLLSFPERAIHAHMMRTHPVSLELQTSIGIVQWRKKQRITKRRSIIVPPTVYGMIVIIIKTIHLLDKIITRIIVASTTLIVCRNILILDVRYKIKNTTLVPYRDSYHQVTPRIIDKRPFIIFVILILEKEQLREILKHMI